MVRESNTFKLTVVVLENDLNNKSIVKCARQFRRSIGVRELGECDLSITGAGDCGRGVRVLLFYLFAAFSLFTIFMRLF